MLVIFVMGWLNPLTCIHSIFQFSAIRIGIFSFVIFRIITGKVILGNHLNCLHFVCCIPQKIWAIYFAAIFDERLSIYAVWYESLNFEIIHDILTMWCYYTIFELLLPSLRWLRKCLSICILAILNKLSFAIDTGRKSKMNGKMCVCVELFVKYCLLNGWVKGCNFLQFV